MCLAPVTASVADLPLTRLRPDSPSYASISGIDEPERLVLRDPASWTEAWRRIHRRARPVPPVPDLDFEREMVVVAALGRQRSAGYSIRIERAWQAAEATVVLVREESPGPGCIVSSVLTSPIDIAVLPFREGAVEFNVESVVRDCP